MLQKYNLVKNFYKPAARFSAVHYSAGSAGIQKETLQQEQGWKLAFRIERLKPRETGCSSFTSLLASSSGFKPSTI
jgi:hypothetical protein